MGGYNSWKMLSVSHRQVDDPPRYPPQPPRSRRWPTYLNSCATADLEHIKAARTQPPSTRIFFALFACAGHESSGQRRGRARENTPHEACCGKGGAKVQTYVISTSCLFLAISSRTHSFSGQSIRQYCRTILQRGERVRSPLSPIHRKFTMISKTTASPRCQSRGVRSASVLG